MKSLFDIIKLDDQGLITAVIQHCDTGQVKAHQKFLRLKVLKRNMQGVGQPLGRVPCDTQTLELPEETLLQAVPQGGKSR